MASIFIRVEEFMLLCFVILEYQGVGSDGGIFVCHRMPAGIAIIVVMNMNSSPFAKQTKHSDEQDFYCSHRSGVPGGSRITSVPTNGGC